jgi:hypothetical protein
MAHESSWHEFAEELKKLKRVDEPLRAEWYAQEGAESYGVWLLYPDDIESEEVRATFSLIAARAISILGISPIPLPEPLQHDPQWTLYCQVEEEMARLGGKTWDLSDAVPFGLGKVDRDAVDPCTRAWLELLRQDSPAFRITGNGSRTMKGKVYPTLNGTIDDVCGASAGYCERRARDEIGEQLTGAAAKGPANTVQTGKGNWTLLQAANGKLKRSVTFDVASQFGGVSKRAIEKAAKKGSLEAEGERPNRRILVESLLKYFPPETNAN